MLRHFITADQLRRERRWFSPSKIAEIHGCSPAAMRQKLSYYGVQVKQEDPYAMIEKLWERGYVEEIAEYMDLPVEMVVRLCVELGYRQLTLWPLREIPKAQPKMKVVHRKEERKPGPVWVQLELELFNEMRIAA